MTPHDPQLPGWLAALIAALGGGLWLRRRLSRDSVAIASDEAETRLIRTLERRIELAEQAVNMAQAEARRERERRTADAAVIAGLQAENAHFLREIERLTRDVRRLAKCLTEEQRRVWESGFSPLDDGRKP